MPELTIEPGVLEGVQRATSRQGWDVETLVTFSGAAGLRLVNAPGGRGVPRDRWLIIAGDGMTLADCFRVLAVCLERIGGDDA